MAKKVEDLDREVKALRKEIITIKSRLDEPSELSAQSVKRLRDARATPEKEYVNLNEL